MAYLIAFAVRGRVARLAGVGVAAALAVVLSASTLVALTSCRQRLGAGADLSGCDLSGFDLAGADLSRSDLTEANLTDADLRRTSLDMAKLGDADLRGAFMRGASFRSASLRAADLRNLNLAGVNLQDADLTDAALDDARLDGAFLIGAAGLTDDALGRALQVDQEVLARTLTERDIRLEAREDILGDLGPACGGQGVPEAGSYPQGNFHPLVILNGDGAVGQDTDRAAGLGWEPMAVRFAQLVACVEDDDPVQVEFCPYQAVGGQTGSITREQHQRQVRVVEAATGRVIFDQTFEGSTPEPCPISHFFQTIDPHETLEGSQVTFANFQSQVARFVE